MTMGYNCYVNNALLPTVRLIQDAYKNGTVNLSDLHLGVLRLVTQNDGNHGDHQNGDHHKEETRNEEKFSPHTPFTKEEKKKEERDIYIPRSRENFIPFPTLEEVREYAKGFENLTFSADFFFHYYNASNWKIKGEPVQNWQSLFEAWVNDPKKGKKPGAPRTTLRQQTLLTAETRMQEEAERQTTEREERLRKQAEESVSYQEYQRMKKEGRL